MKHKLFLSFYHADEPYREEFQRQFGALYLSKSVQPGDINTNVSTEYIKRLIREGYIADASVVVVLIGPHTRHRKHVDWEISAGLEPGKGRSGLVGLILPELPLDQGSYDPADIPPRLWQNIQSGFARMHSWKQVDHNPSALAEIVEDAYARRLMNDLAKNSLPQMRENTGP